MASPTRPSADVVHTVQRDGITAIVEIAGGFSDADWTNPTPCEGWDALDLATHLVTVTTMWHQALDDALAGITTARWTYESMPADNAEMMAGLPDASGPERIAAFVEGAESWLDRVAHTDPDLLIPVAVQDVAAVPITVGLFAWTAGVEWHIHAWDLAQSAGRDYRTPHGQTMWDAIMRVRGADEPQPADPWQQLVAAFRPQRG